MEENKKNESGDDDVQPDDKSELLQDFIDRKKLENRILGEILKKIKKAENSNKSQPSTNNEKP